MSVKKKTNKTAYGGSPGMACSLSSVLPEAVSHALKRRQKGNPIPPRKTAQLCVIIDAETQGDLADMLELMVDKMRESDQLGQVGGIGGYASTCSWASIQNSPENDQVELPPNGGSESKKDVVGG